jgi:hypothetical protein
VDIALLATVIKGTTQCFAINGNHASYSLCQAGHPIDKALLELLGVQRAEQNPQLIMGWRPICVRQKVAQEIQLFLTPGCDLDPPVRSGKHRT